MITAKIKVCGVAERFPLVSLRDKRRSLNRAVLTHPDQLATHILKTTTTGEDLRVTRLKCNSGVNSGTGATTDRNGPFSVVSYGHIVFSSKIYSPSYVSIKRMGSVPKNSVPSQHSRQWNKYQTEQPFLSLV